MDREPDGVDDAGPRAPGTGASRRLIVAGLAAGLVLLVVIAVLATWLASTPGAPKAVATPRPTPTPTTSLTVPDIYQRVAPSVVTVRAGRELGTGVIVADNGTIVTADHVVAAGGSVTVTFADGTATNANVASADKKMDIAVLIPARLPQVVVPATLGGTAGIGSAVVAIGNPLGLTDSVSSGIVSGLDRTADTDTGKRTGLIQFDAAANPGNSGGPLVTMDGAVVGIVTGILNPNNQRVFIGIGFAVPIENAAAAAGMSPF